MSPASEKTNNINCVLVRGDTSRGRRRLSDDGYIYRGGSGNGS